MKFIVRWYNKIRDRFSGVVYHESPVTKVVPKKVVKVSSKKKKGKK
jgi:hypothetical protein